MIDKLKFLIDRCEHNPVLKGLCLKIAALKEEHQEATLKVIEMMLDQPEEDRKATFQELKATIESRDFREKKQERKELKKGIEAVHKKNFELIENHKLKVGTILMHKRSKDTIVITHIHNLYGWVTSKKTHMFGSSNLSEDLQNIYDFEVVESGKQKLIDSIEQRRKLGQEISIEEQDLLNLLRST